MERFIPPAFRLFDSYIAEHHLVHTDPRYNTGNGSNVLDVVEYSDDGGGESYKRLLLISREQEQQADFLWKTMAGQSSAYVIPQKQEADSDAIVRYEIPVSTRPLIHETKLYRSEAQNRMNNERILRSLVGMLKNFHQATGLYIDPVSVESRSAIIDFVDEGIEPVIFVPPTRLIAADVPLPELYRGVFSHDQLFRHTFQALLSESE